MKLRCKDFGFKCKFVIEEKDVESLLKGFRKHTLSQHEMGYSDDIIKQHIIEED